MPKAEVRALARDFGLTIADKADSQDICFVPSGRYTDVIARLNPGALQPGDIMHIDGRPLGRHDGIINYTVGQRRGLRIPAPEPLYVVSLDPARNVVVVGPKSALGTRTLHLRQLNWLATASRPDTGAEGLPVYARVRSTQPPKPATLFVSEGVAKVVLLGLEDGIASGQACVLYEDEAPQARILGGGTIARAITEAAIAAADGPMCAATRPDGPAGRLSQPT
jgi:tRNA-uridine 2-sulfurtransferase